MKLFKGKSEKYTDEERKFMANSWNREGLELNKLYWIKTKEMTDPFTEGYIGVAGSDDRVKSSKREAIKDGFGTEETIESVILAEGEGRAINLLETWYRPEHGLGWNYMSGGGRGHGGGTSNLLGRQKSFDKLKNKPLYEDFKRG